MVTHPDCYEAIIDTPVEGVKLGLNTLGTALCNIDFVTPEYSCHIPDNGFIRTAVDQFLSYFENPRFTFTVPFVVEGTPFQRRVWRELQEIPAGVTWTYGMLAQRLATSARAIGGACRSNPLPILVPCHRVVALNGLGGFSGQTRGHKLLIKRWLLDHEVGV